MHYDVAVIGAGPAGTASVLRAAEEHGRATRHGGPQCFRNSVPHICAVDDANSRGNVRFAYPTYSAVIGLAARRLLAEPTAYSPSADRT